MKDDFTVAGHRNSNHKCHLASNKPTLTVDVERYQAYLDGANMTEAQKAEFLQALWMIVVSCVELGFGVHPLQDACGKNAKIGCDSAKGAFDAVKSGKPTDSKNTDDFSP
ncbi:hypothetical protein [Paracoccus alkenifer]|uniref:Uncharacterized protein n=1 Tax=Paracoccus alkenifer TaxID=65735 RepID=A0A1H6JLG2_9RHOB|nr:hypothetical protein [Paracoccus alkenifer]SEH60592.1 hypothetical protein SAMN04488075_0321 [Paracoccus alkenifer]